MSTVLQHVVEVTSASLGEPGFVPSTEESEQTRALGTGYTTSIVEVIDWRDILVLFSGFRLAMLALILCSYR